MPVPLADVQRNVSRPSARRYGSCWTGAGCEPVDRPALSPAAPPAPRCPHRASCSPGRDTSHVARWHLPVADAQSPIDTSSELLVAVCATPGTVPLKRCGRGWWPAVFRTLRKEIKNHFPHGAGQVGKSDVSSQSFQNRPGSGVIDRIIGSAGSLCGVETLLRHNKSRIVGGREACDFFPPSR